MHYYRTFGGFNYQAPHIQIRETILFNIVNHCKFNLIPTEENQMKLREHVLHGFISNILNPLMIE